MGPSLGARGVDGLPVCPRCGAVGEGTYCPSCGAAFQPPYAAYQAPYTTYQQPYYSSYPPQPYSYPPQAYYSPYQGYYYPPRDDSQGSLAMILGVLALVFTFALGGVGGIVVGLIAMHVGRKAEAAGQSGGHTGYILGLVAVVLGVVMVAFFLLVFTTMLGFSGT